MNKIILALTAFAFLTANPFAVVNNSASAAMSATNDHYDIPLVVVRFNQSRIFFQKPLTNAVKRALNISPEVKFKVISYIPTKNSVDKKKLDSNVNAVLQQIYASGVRPANVEVKKQASQGLGYHEVHLYVY